MISRFRARITPSLAAASILFLVCGASCHAQQKQQPIRNYVFFESARERIREDAFRRASLFDGAQLKYTWRELEPQPDKYDFHAIREDLASLDACGKRLFLQIQDVTFTPAGSCLPDYLLHDPQFHGGANRQFNIVADNEINPAVDGWIARRWDPAVEKRFERLLTALGKEFDGKIPGVNLAETAAEFGETGRLYPSGFSPNSYLNGILAELQALRAAFPKSVTMIYANFMPGEWLPWSNHHYLSQVYDRARTLGVGVAGPDCQPYKKGQMAHSYPLIAASAGVVPTGIAVQEGNYAYTSPRTKRKITVAEQIAFAKDYLKVGWMFWFPEEPYFERDVVSTLQAERRTRHDTLPTDR